MMHRENIVVNILVNILVNYIKNMFCKYIFFAVKLERICNDYYLLLCIIENWQSVIYIFLPITLIKSHDTFLYLQKCMLWKVLHSYFKRC